MVSLGKTDRTKPIGDQRICFLSDEILNLFPDLALHGQEREWCNWTPKQLTDEVTRGNEYAIKTFRQKLICCSIVDGLLRSNQESVRQGIEEISTHVNSGPLNRYIFRQAYKIRSNADLQKRIEPVTNALIEAACLELKTYVDRAGPEVLDNHYRNFRVFSSAVARLSPAVAPALHQEFSRILGSRRTEFAPNIFLESFRALGYQSDQITEWDEQYVTAWRCVPESPEGWARGADTAAYNAPSSIGWRLMKIHPRHAPSFLRKHRDSILRSLIVEMHHKCTHDPAANAARLAVRFLNLHLALHALNGAHAYRRLSPDLTRRVQRIAEAVRRAMRGSNDNFDGKLEVEKIAGAVKAFLENRTAHVPIPRRSQ
jgi:hypothetical protein